MLISSKMSKFNEEIMHLYSADLSKMKLHERTLKNHLLLPLSSINDEVHFRTAYDGTG
jgi:hypothetical protein